MTDDNKFHEDFGKLKSDVSNLSISVDRLHDSVDKLSPTLSKVSQQMDDSLDRDRKADVIISKISEEVSVLSHIQKVHSESIDEYKTKIAELEKLAMLIRNSKVYARAVWGLIAAGIVLIGFYYMVTNNKIEMKKFEIQTMQVQADIDQKKKREENNLARYYMKNGRTVEKTIKETQEG